MNKLKFIPSLAIVALLSACGAKANRNVKEPKFDKQGEEVEALNFFSSLGSDLQGADFAGEKKLNSFLGQSESLEMRKQAVQRDGKKTNNSWRQESSKVKLQSDAKSFVAKLETTDKMAVDMAVGSMSGAGTQEVKATNFFQEVKYDGGSYLANVDTAAKTVSLMNEIDDSDHTIDVLYDEFIRNEVEESLGLKQAMMFISSLQNLSEEEKAKYDFFKNGKVYTVVYDFESEEPYEYKNSNDELVYSVNEKAYNKAQISLENGNLKIVRYENSTTTVTFSQMYYSDEDDMFLFEGDVLEIVEQSSYVSSVTFKDVTVKAASTDNYMVY